MPLTSLQVRILALIAKNRSTESYVAGGAALNRNYPRLSDDIDIFNDPGLSLAEIAQRDINSLVAGGLSLVQKDDRYGMIIDAIISDGTERTMIQWQDETRSRFIAIVSDTNFGMRLSDADLAVNKILAAAGRKEPRDVVDLVTLAANYAPLGPLVWAASAKSELAPGRIIERISRHANEMTSDKISTVRTSGAPPSRALILRDLESELSRAQLFIERAPVEWREHLFLSPDNIPIEADAVMLANGKARALPLVEFGHVILTMAD